MKKILNAFVVLFCAGAAFSQDYISFRNTLNEGNYWFYEGNFDSALVYYDKAEQFKLRFFPEELHLYSRTLWEVGQKEKSLSVLIPYGLRDFFTRDTTYYHGLSREQRMKFALKLKLNEIDLLADDMVFYRDLEKKDQMYRKVIFNYAKNSIEHDSILTLMVHQDSLNFIALVHQVKKNGYPGGYKMAPIGPDLILLHAKQEWILNYYWVFINEIKAGRMSYFAFSKAIDRMFPCNENHGPYNAYSPASVSEVNSPALIFINRCSIGMSPYYDVYIPRLYRRGLTPPKSKLYEFYKKHKQNFNCIRIK